MINGVAFHYFNSKNDLRGSKNYSAVCQTILNKYPALNSVVVKMCKLENANPSGVKRLQPHVSILFCIVHSEDNRLAKKFTFRK